MCIYAHAHKVKYNLTKMLTSSEIWAYFYFFILMSWCYLDFFILNMSNLSQNKKAISKIHYITYIFKSSHQIQTNVLLI